MWVNERTFLVAGDRTDLMEITPGGDLIVENADNDGMDFVCFSVNSVGSDMSRAEVRTSDKPQKEIGVGSGGVVERLEGGVEINHVGGTSPNSIRVSWRLTSPRTDTSRVDGFYVLYRQKDNPEIIGFTSLTVLHAAATSYVVNRLLPYTEYEFLVIPFQRGSPGEASSLHKAHTMEVRPIGSPTGLRWRQVNTSSVEISWRPMEEESFKGVPKGYQARPQPMYF